jgi:hypothetical protein
VARGALSDYAAGKLYDASTGRASCTTPANLYLALYNADPGSDGSAGTEESGGAYARTLVTFGAATAGLGSTNIAVEFIAATAAWVDVLGFAIFDDPTAGNMWWHGAFDASTPVPNGTIFKVNSGQISLDVNNKT